MLNSKRNNRKKENTMSTTDTACSIVPYFKIHEGQMSAFRELCEAFVEATKSESACLYYGFSFDGDRAHCREAYKNAEGVLAHLDNVGAILEKALQIADLETLEIHGPASELAKLKEPLSSLDITWFTLEYGFRA
jgi:quinol monooxygenase YgiN